MASASKTRPARDAIAARKPSREVDRFESVLSRALAALARVSAHDIDREVERWLGEICLTLDLDRSAIIYQGQGVTHRWNRRGIPPAPYGLTGVKVSPWITNRILDGDELIWSKGTRLPQEAADYERYMADVGQTAQVAMPFRVAGLKVGGVTFGKFRTGYRWQPQVLRQLRLVAEFLGHLLQRRDIELQLESVRSELTLASRRTMMGDLVASISHEVNQPLGAILSNAQTARRMLNAERPAIADVIPALTDIVDDAKRASEIVRRVRAMFKGDETSRSLLQISALLQECDALLKSEAANRKIELTVNADPKLPAILGDRIQLLQCVTNLVLNAFDSIDASSTGPREVTIDAGIGDAGYIKVSVCDSGAGIDATLIDKIFEAFVTTKPHGMGMGLLVVRSIVERHGGRIFAVSNPGGGATLTFAIPTARMSLASGTDSDDERTDESSRNRRRRVGTPSA